MSTLSPSWISSRKTLERKKRHSTGVSCEWRSPVQNMIPLGVLLLGLGALSVSFSEALALRVQPQHADASRGDTRDTSRWVGSAYTPAGAPGNSLWWHSYDAYEPAVKRELGLASRVLGINTVRVFLHSMVFRNDSQRLLDSMDRFLSVAVSNGIAAGFVLFDDCWNHAGASLDTPCVPHDGRHNSCWMASPQDDERTKGFFAVRGVCHEHGVKALLTTTG